MNNLNKIINLIKKTGDKFVVLDEYGESFVVMPLNDYEKIVEGKSDYGQMSEKELFDSVERDISLWRAEHEDYENMEPPMPEPWEMEKESWERKPLPFSDFDKEELEPSWEEDEDFFDAHDSKWGAVDAEDESLTMPWDEDEEIEETKRDKFSIPKERFEHQEGSEPIKYEDIPSPPSVNISDIMDNEEKKEEIIDMSFEDEDSDFSIEDKEEEESEEFMEESVF